MVITQQDALMEEINKTEHLQTQTVDIEQIHTSMKECTKIMNIIHINIRSIKKNFDNLLLLIEQLKPYYNDIIILSETFQVENIDYFNIDGYRTYYNEAVYNRNDGMIVFAHENLDIHFETTTLSRTKATISRIIAKDDSNTIGITAVYKSPMIKKEPFRQDIEEYLEANSSQNIEIFTGDINIDLQQQNNDEVNKYMVTMMGMGYVSYINSITRPETGTTLDHFYVKTRQENNINIKPYILNNDTTDHFPIILQINRIIKEKTDSLNNNRNITMQTTNTDEKMYTKYWVNINKLQNSLQNQDWTKVTNEQNPENATQTFTEIYKAHIDKATTTSVIKMKHKKIKKWITTGLICSIKHRDKLKKQLRQTKTPEREKEYRTYRNHLNTLIAKQKKEYYRQQIDNNKNDMRKMYDIVKDATNEKRAGRKKIEILKNQEKDNTFQNDKEMANYCNDYYTTIGEKMNEKIPNPTQPYLKEKPNIATMFLSPVTKNDLIKNISELKTNSAPGHDNITARTIKQTHKEILEPIQHIVNRIFETSIIPNDMKTTIITPIHKAGTETNIANYRPISTITTLTKIFEKCLKDKIIKFLQQHNIISPNQYGFLEGKSTTDALHTFTKEITEHLNHSRKSIGVFIDLAKAFDTVPHDKLQNVMNNYGIRGTTLELMKNYLEKRQQITKINNTFSTPKEVKIGIPQGTVIGPILFIMYLNSLLKADINGTIISYADDTALIFHGQDWEEVKQKTKIGIKIVINWLETNRLTINMKKTNYLAFSLTKANRPIYCNIDINETIIKEAQHTKYLGIMIDKYLKWQPHMDYLTQRLRKLIYKFYILRTFLTTNEIIVIYKTLVESLLTYGIIVWGGIYNNALSRLNIIQKYLLKLIYKKNKLYPTRLLFTTQTVNIRTMYATAICVHIHYHKTREDQINHKKNTRGKTEGKLKNPKNLKNINMRSYTYLAPQTYNLLPEEIKRNLNKKKFTRICKEYIHTNYDTFTKLFT